MAAKTANGYDYDFFVVGGGSGGLASVKEAAKFGAKCAVADFVKPSPQGTSWGLGGTCVNVGCIPKKLMHHGALIGEDIKLSKQYGWRIEGKVTHDWGVMVDRIQEYIASLNFGHRSECMKEGIQYFNEMVTFVDPHTVECTDKRGKKTLRTAEKFLISVGGRPNYPDIPGARECCISSDDIFSLDHPPGKTLVVGASYVALECAGFLHAFGYDVTVMVRSILLRGFDQQIAKMIGLAMQEMGTQFIFQEIPKSFEKTSDGKVLVRWGADQSDTFDTVMLAIGRYPDVDALNLPKLGIKTNPRNGKIVAKNEQTCVESVYALGDCIDGVPELTPSAIQAGRLLARRLYGGSTALMDYHNIATTVFTPIEYGTIGYSEEAAIERYGEQNLEVFHVHWKPLKWSVMDETPSSLPYCKLICNKTDNLRVLGFHFLGPNAGEVTQGFSAAVRAGLTYQDVIDTVGIHPTDAEQVVGLVITKSSGESPKPPGC
jgi:thioredoxin reductase (NADPH)